MKTENLSWCYGCETHVSYRDLDAKFNHKKCKGDKHFGVCYNEKELMVELKERKQKERFDQLSIELKQFCDEHNYTTKPLHTVMPFVMEYIEKKYKIKKKKEQ